MTSCSPFLWNPGNPRCFFDAGHILIKKWQENIPEQNSGNLLLPRQRFQPDAPKSREK